nr:hypothetical protein [Tanacetum cinerariifolium]
MDIFAFIHTPDPTKSPLIVLKASWRIVLRDCLMRVVVAPKQSKEISQGKLLVGAVLNVEVEVTAIPTLPFVTAYVSTTSEREDGDHTDSMVKPNLCTIRAPQRFVISSDSSHHSGTKVAEADVDSLIRSSIPIMTIVTTTTSTVDPTLATKRKFVEPSLFAAGSSSAGETDPITGVLSYHTGSDFLVGVIHTVINPDTDLRKVYVPQWSMMNGSHLDDGRVYREMVDEFTPPKFFTMRAEYNVKEKRRLKSVVENQGELLKAREEEIESLKARLLLKEAKAAEAVHLFVNKERELTNLNALVTSIKSQNDNLAECVHEIEISSCRLQEKVTVYENCMEQLEKFLDDRMKVVNDKFNKLYTNFVEMTLHLEEKFYPHLLTTISGRRWLLTQGIELAIIKYLNSPEYLSTLGAAIDKAIEKGMQDGLSAGITHGKEGRVLTDVAAYNPSAEADYISALQQL